MRTTTVSTARIPVTLFECMGWAVGFEPTATGTTIRRSTKLSYAHREGNPSIVTSRCGGRNLSDVFPASASRAMP